MKLAATALSVGLALLIGACVRPPPPAPPRETKLDLRITNFALSNGLRVVLVHDPRAPEVQVTMRYQVGSVDDPPGQAGVAHLVEHLMFQQVLGAQSLFAHLEDDATFFNAYTTLDATTYVARAHPSRLDALLSIEAVRVGFRCTSITDSVFVREREVVLNELEEDKDVDEILAAIHHGLYPADHPYRRPVGGTEASVAAITHEQACAFADAHYAPKNAVLAVSGAITADQLETSLRKFITRVPGREVAARIAVPRLDRKGRTIKVPAPIDEKVLIIAWPLPPDPQLRTKVRAIAATMQALIDRQVKGHVLSREFGDDRAPMLAVAVLPHKDESLEEVQQGAKRAILRLPDVFAEQTGTFGEIAFNQIKQGAIYELFATLEDGGTRDLRLAAHAHAGLDPSAALGGEIEALRAMTREEAARVARVNLRVDLATTLVLEPRDETKRGRDVQLTSAVHDRGQRRDSPDPADARRPAAATIAARGFDSMTTRTLPNGLRVVLLPVTSVPTVDVRVIFGSGTADEPTGKRGAALLAAHALTWQPRFLNDLLLFSAAGGTNAVDLGTDHTSFWAHGLDMHLDLLLAGLRRWVRDGRYGSGADMIVEAMRREAKKVDDDGAITDAWRAARFGARHPYARAGLVRHASRALTVEDAERFRTAHYTPDNATIVIAGRFDAALADRWIDYLFGDWTGARETRRRERAFPQPASIAKADATTQVHLHLALPAVTESRAQRLVAAAMLAGVAGAVRHQLGASYGLASELVESRLAASYQIAGWVDARRTSEAVELLRARLEALRTDADAAARAFVSARKRALTQIVAVTGSAQLLAGRVQRDIELERAPMADLETAAAVQQLTIDDMTATLAELDLSRAVISMRGPATEIERAFAVLGRTPTYVRAAEAAPDAREPVPMSVAAVKRRRDDYFSPYDLADPLTQQGPATRLTWALIPAYSLGSVISRSVNGLTVSGELGYRLGHRLAIGLHASFGTLGGRYETGRYSERHTIAMLPVGLAAFVQTSAYDRLWGGVLVGAHLDRVTDDDSEPVWHRSLGLGLQGGIDIVRLRRQRFGVYGRAEAHLLSDAFFGAFTFGLAYRR